MQTIAHTSRPPHHLARWPRWFPLIVDERVCRVGAGSESSAARRACGSDTRLASLPTLPPHPGAVPARAAACCAGSCSTTPATRPYLVVQPPKSCNKNAWLARLTPSPHERSLASCFMAKTWRVYHLAAGVKFAAEQRVGYIEHIWNEARIPAELAERCITGWPDDSA